ncbi:MAG: type II secretion system F family protein [Clostridiales bacterium]|nr:type II secretion system F family protein [Clostridiales bacterium]
MNPSLLAAGTFLTAFLATSLLLLLVEERRRQARQAIEAARAVWEGIPLGEEKPKPRPFWERWRGRAIEAAEKVAAVRKGEDWRRRLSRQLRRAGLLWRPEEFLALQASVALLGAGFFALLLRSLGFAPIGFLLGWMGMGLYLTQRQHQRLLQVERDLPTALDMMSGALKAGNSLLQAMETVSREMDSPLARELEQVIHEIRLNVSLEDALANLLDRVPSDDLDLMVTAIQIQRQVGGNLAVILETIASTIRGRLQVLAEVRVLTSQGRLSGWIVGLLPVALLLFMAVANPGYVQPLFTTPVGRILLLLGVVLEGIGALIIRKIIQIEV